MDNIMKNTVKELKALIDKKGPTYLLSEPYLTYKELSESDFIEGQKVSGTRNFAVLASMIIVVFLTYTLAKGNISIGLFISLTSAAFNWLQLMSWKPMVV